MTSVHGKVVFITGGARGIGAEVARRLRNKGAKLVLTDLDEDALDALAAKLGGDDRVLTVVADVRDLPAMQAAADEAVERFGGIDVVVANAGIASYGSVLQVDPEAFKRVLEVNVLGVFHTVRATLPAVIDRRGYVLIVSSLAAFAAAPGLAPYNTTKAGIEISPTRCGWRLPTSASALDRRTCPGSTPPWFATPRRTCPRSPTARGVALAVEQDHLCGQVRDGLRQGHRGPQGSCVLPGLGGADPLAQAAAVHPARRTSHSQEHAGLMPRMDAEVAALGRSTSAYNEELGNA